MVELKVLYLILSLLALNTVLSKKRTKNTPESLDVKLTGLPDFKVPGFLSVKQLQQRNVSQDFLNKEIFKLKSSLYDLKNKIQSGRKNHEKLMRRIPQKCLNIKCPFEEKPVCVKFSSKDGKHKPFYVNLINDCEMRYMQCRQGLEATIVASKNCHSVLDIINKPLFEHQLPPLPAPKRSKREVKEEDHPTENTNLISDEKNETPQKTLAIDTTIPQTNIDPKDNLSKNTNIEVSNHSKAKYVSSNKTTINNIVHKKLNHKVAKLNLRNVKKTSLNKATSAHKKINGKTSANKILSLNSNVKHQKQTNKIKNSSLHSQNINSNAHKIVKLKGKTVKKKITAIDNKQLELKGKKPKAVYVENNVKKVKLLNNAKVLSNKISPHKIAASKAPVKIETLSATKNNSNSTDIITEATETPLEPSAITTASQKNAGLRDNTELDNSKNQKINIRHKDLRASKEYFEKNVGDEKMFTHDVFKKNLNENGEGSVELDANLKAEIPIINDNGNTNDEPIYKPENENEPQIEGEADIDDENLGVLPDNEEAVFSDNEPVIEGTIEIDDDFVKTNLNDYNVANGENAESEPNMFNDGDPLQDGDFENGEGEIAANEQLELPYDPNLPLVDEPEVEGDRYNDDPNDFDYVYEPKDPPIVVLPNEEGDNFYEDEADQGVGDDTNVKPEESIEQSETAGVYPGGGYDTPDKEDDGGGDFEHIPADGDYEHPPPDGDYKHPPPDGDYEHPPPNGDYKYPPPDGDDNYQPEMGNENDSDGVDRQEMESDCPRECPARNMMVCAMCEHGIYRTFLSVCHMRMFSCKGPHKDEKLHLVSRYPCVMSAPIITEDPPMQPKGRLSDPSDHDRVLRYIRCKERGQLEKNANCSFDDNVKQLSLIHNQAETSPFEY